MKRTLFCKSKTSSSMTCSDVIDIKVIFDSNVSDFLSFLDLLKKLSIGSFLGFFRFFRLLLLLGASSLGSCHCLSLSTLLGFDHLALVALGICLNHFLFLFLFFGTFFTVVGFFIIISA